MYCSRRFARPILSLTLLSAACVPSYEGPQTLGEAGWAYLPNHNTQGEWSVEVPGSTARLLMNGSEGSYRVSLDGENLSRVLPQKPLLRMRAGRLDPITQDPMMLIPSALQQSAEMTDLSGKRAYIVQFVAQPLDAIQAYLTELGVQTLMPIPDHSLLVHMDRDALELLRKQPMVRWVGYYHSGFKLDRALVEEGATKSSEHDTYAVMLVGPQAEMKRAVTDQIEREGGFVETVTSDRLVIASLHGALLTQLAQMKEVLFIDALEPAEEDANIAREIGGGARLETLRGYTGQGVRAEVMDGGLRITHEDFAANPPIIHTGNSSNTGHGTPVYGIVFGSGAGDASARGFLPDADQPIFSSYSSLRDRMAHTARLVDPAGPYRAVFQTNSWGNGRTRNYTTLSAQLDDILFRHDMVLLQSQSNAGNQDSRPQAWAKNAISVGGVRHFNTLDRGDDQWNGSASIGPASDGRIKPDLWHFYDFTRAPSNTSDTSHRQFGGTSGATPITAGHMGLLMQMWADGVFAGGPGQNRDVFDVRPHMTTAKALLINGAFQYAFTGTGDDKARDHQGWGMPDVGQLYDLAEANGWSLPILIDESAVITPTEVHSYTTRADGATPLKVTLVYADPAGSPSAAQHRVNDLSLRVTDPSGTVYWGNNGLRDGLWSSPGGQANDVDTVENVFIQAPSAGIWTIEVLADEIVQDGHTETAALDADYALVVTHVQTVAPNSPPSLSPIGDRSVEEGDTLSFSLNASDPDGDPLTFAATGLPPNASLDVAGAFSFSPDLSQAGTYSVVFSVSDAAGATAQETVTITVTDRPVGYATLPYSTDFEGPLDEYWSTASERAEGRVRLTNLHGPRGAQHLTMDVSTNNSINTNEAQLRLDLSGQQQVELRFWWKEFSDENHPEDGVFFSDDGGANFTKVHDLVGGTSTYTEVALDVDSLASANGLSLSSTFVVKLQQRDNFTMTSDGFAFDDLSVTPSTSTGGCAPIYSNDFESGAGGWAFSAADSTCTTGDWTVGTPDEVVASGTRTQVGEDHSAVGTNAFFTAPNTGGVGTNDVDRGVCTAYSSVIDASAHGSVELSLWYYHGQRDAGDDAQDFFSIDLSNDGGATFTTNVVSLGDINSSAEWTEARLVVSNPGRMVIRVQASDGTGAGDLVEGGIDDIEVCAPN